MLSSYHIIAVHSLAVGRVFGKVGEKKPSRFICIISSVTEHGSEEKEPQQLTAFVNATSHV